MRDPGRAQPRRGYVPGRGSRILCEQVHQVAEFSIVAVITANGHSFVTSHDLKELLETARDAGGRIRRGSPPVSRRSGELSTFAGSGRYDFGRPRARMGRRG